MNQADIIRHELIGLEARIARSTNRSLAGVNGVIVDESRNTLTIKNKRRKLIVPKQSATFRFTLTDGTFLEVEGYRLVARPENRLKSKVRRW